MSFAKYLIFALLLVPIFAIDDKLAKKQFGEFVAKYKKSYKNNQETLARFSTFKKNLELIEEMNQKVPSAKYGITKFADISPQEFEDLYLMKHTDARKVAPTRVQLPKNLDIPDSFDWRDKGAVTPTYDQGQCGSCWAFSATEAIESQWFLAGHPLISLGPQQIVDCDTGGEDEGCNGGDTTTAYEYVIKAGGMENSTDYPYAGVDETCAFQKSEVVAKISSWTYITTTKNETEMQVGLIAKGPLSICVDAQSWQFYVGGVISAECGDNLDHCVMITGFGDKTGWDGLSYQVWNIRNSWGEGWGDGGYLYVERNYDLCGVADEVTIPLV